MAKKKLTQNQQRRIESKKLDDSINNVSDTNQNSKLETGLIVCHYGKEVDIENSINKIIRCNLRQNLPALAVGDLVKFEVNQTTQNNSNNSISLSGIVTNLLPRKSVLERTSVKNRAINTPNQPNRHWEAHKNKSKPIAANLEQIFIIFAPEPKPQSYLIDQIIIIAETCNLEPVLVLNKVDIYQQWAKSKDRNLKQQYQEIKDLLNIYKTTEYKLLQISGLHDHNYSKLSELLENKTSIFVGQSGVGKSTITKKLVPNLDSLSIATGEISDRSQLGKHTTTAAKLYHLQNNANLIDAPGVREMGVVHLDRQAIEQAYIEFRPYLGQCKFKDCEHEHEPDCALKQALLDGKIHPQRWENYKKFVS